MRLSSQNILSVLCVSLACFPALNISNVSAQDGTSIGRHYADEITLLTRDSAPYFNMGSAEVLDINGDGKSDIAFSGFLEDTTLPGTLYLLTSNSSGTMDFVTEDLVQGGIPNTPRGYRQILPGDFNGDGHVDLFLESHGSEPDCGDGSVNCWVGGQNSLLLSDGNGKFDNVTETHLPVLSDFSHGSTVLDYDGDDDLDVWVNNLGGSDLLNPVFSYLLQNDGAGVLSVIADFAKSWETPLVGGGGILPEGNDWGSGFWAVAIDADGDGDTDLALGLTELWQGGDTFLFRTNLLINDGPGHFELLPEDAWPSPTWADYTLVQHALVYDLNRDGLADQLLHQSRRGDFKPSGLQVLISNGDGTFRDETAERYPFTPIDALGEFMLHDLDGDGHKDLFNQYNFGSVDIRVNDGEGYFRRLEADWVTPPSWNWVVLDVDGDGGTDFLVVGYGGQTSLHKMNLPYGPELDGTANDDRLIGGAHDNAFRGLAGNDVLDGGLGDDSLDGGPGDDTLIGGKGDDWYVYNNADLTGKDTINDKAGNDQLKFVGFGLEKVTGASQGNDGSLILNLAGGGKITVEKHFLQGGFGVEKLVVGSDEYVISRNPAFQSGSIQDLLAEFQIDAGLNGNWWNGPVRSGEGVQVEISDGGGGSLIMVTTVYSYDTMGNQVFMITVGAVNGDTAEVDVFITEGGLWGDDFDPALVKESQWGTGTFSASSCDAMHMELKPSAEYKARGYTDLMYDLIRLTAPAAPCPMDNPN